MRSSIACSRCRRSKIKCVNAGIDTTCRACESSGRDCVYPTPAVGAGAAAAAAAAAKRDFSALADPDDRNGDWESLKRQRSRKPMSAAAAGTGKDNSAKASPLVLDSSLLTVKVWETLFELFQLHFSTTLPFLHPTTFLAQIRQLSRPTIQTDGQPTNDRSQSPSVTGVSPLILLGILTLTARFHPQLVQHHSHSSSTSSSSTSSTTAAGATMSSGNPLAASEFYANALRARLTGPDGADLVSVDIDRVQALLMLALHEWGMCRGKSAWVYVGMAVRMAQAMGLGVESDNNDAASSSSPRPSFVPNSTPNNVDHRDRKDHNSDDVIEQETRRRTFWSCFLLDRCVSTGKFRPRMIHVRDMDIQLPSDNAFAFGERVRTSRLGDGYSAADRRRSNGYDARGTLQSSSGLRQSVGMPDDSRMRPNSRGMTADSKHWSTSSHRSDGLENGMIDRWEVGAEEGVLGRLIRMFRVWGSISKWSCAGGRKVDRHHPWHPESHFSQLREQLIEFQEGLSRNLRYSSRNTDTHIMYKNTLAPYSLMHIIYFLSVIVLHRTYLPFQPLQYPEPAGPMEDPSFPADRYNAPDGFWRDSAREVFKAARQMMELVKVCHDRGVLTEVPLVGFAVYNAAFMGVYAAHFNHMDQEGYVCSKANMSDVIPGAGGQGQTDVRKAIEILAEMRPRLKMAVGWFRTIHRLHAYYFVSRSKNESNRGSLKPDLARAENDVAVNGKALPPGSPGFVTARDELKRLDRTLTELGSGEDQPSAEVNGADEDTATAPERGPASDSAASNAVKSDSGNDLDSHVDGPRMRPDSWVPVNSPNRGLSGRDGAGATERDPVRNELGPIQQQHHHHRSMDNDRWPNLPPPQSTPSNHSLPTIHPPPQHGPPTTPNASSCLPPPRAISPASYSSSSALPPYLRPSSPSSNKLQPLQSWQTPAARSQPSYSQSLPSLSATAQHGFAMPPLMSSSSLHNPPATNLPHHGPTSPPRFDSKVRPAALEPTQANSAVAAGSLGGDDVIAFVVGESCENWAATAASSAMCASQVGGVPSGWLSVVWDAHER